MDDSDVVSVSADTEVSEIIETMLEERIGAVPVVDGDGAVIGIISYVDLLRALSSPSPTGEARRARRRNARARGGDV